MQYLGGKSRIAKHIAPFVQQALVQKDGKLLEPFVGGFNIVPAIEAQSVVCSDIHEGLICLYRALVDGWLPPSSLAEEEYQELRRVSDWGNPLTAFAAFGCSFGAKEWGGYARSGRRNFALAAKKSLLKKLAYMDRCKFYARPYWQWRPKNCVVYCDPPYKDTTRYKTLPFDHVAFYRWCEEASLNGCIVLVSEFYVPSHWQVIWRATRHIMVTGKKQSPKTRTELLAVPSSHY